MAVTGWCSGCGGLSLEKGSIDIRGVSQNAKANIMKANIMKAIIMKGKEFYGANKS